MFNLLQKKGRNSAEMKKKIVAIEKLEALINGVFEYSPEDERLPNALCNMCNGHLNQVKNGSRDREVLEPDLSQFKKRINTRSSNE